MSSKQSTVTGLQQLLVSYFHLRLLFNVRPNFPEMTPKLEQVPHRSSTEEP